MRRGFSTPLVIAIMAFAVVSFLFLIDTAMNPDGAKKTTNTNTTNLNAPANQNVNIEANNNTNTTVDSIAGWKTYTNTQLKYSIMYPSDWGIGLETDRQITISGAGGGTPFSAPSLSISTGEPDQPSSCLLNEEMVVVLGQDRLRQTQGCGYAGSSIATFFKTGATYLEVSWSEDVRAEYPTYETMLSTFTFTDPTAGWKTYTNGTYGYSIKYPNDYRITPTPNGELSILIEKGESGLAGYYFLTIGIVQEQPNNDADENLYTWAKKGFPENDPIALYHANPRKVNLGSNTFTMTDGDRASSAIPEYLVFHNEILYRLLSYSGDASQTPNKELIATFSFTN